MQNWDYGWNAAYFITICTNNREHYFGEIENGKMYMSSIGVITDVMWHEIKNHATNIELDTFMVMPNHVHGILILNNDGQINDMGNVAKNDSGNVTGNVETGHALPLPSTPQPPQTIGQKRFQNIGKNSVSSIIGSYKSAVTKHAHRMGYCFEWQPRFHDHIIRDHKAFETIQTYIIENPAKWPDDKFFNQKLY
ncbi:MAG: transposase [Bacteroidales bacterium]|nr:transposase [Bacteroidales bacterium]